MMILREPYQQHIQSSTTEASNSHWVVELKHYLGRIFVLIHR
jgi:hypothetical protein